MSDQKVGGVGSTLRDEYMLMVLTIVIFPLLQHLLYYCIPFSSLSCNVCDDCTPFARYRRCPSPVCSWTTPFFCSHSLFLRRCHLHRTFDNVSDDNSVFRISSPFWCITNHKMFTSFLYDVTTTNSRFSRSKHGPRNNT